MIKDTLDFLKGFDWHNVVTIGVCFYFLHGQIADLRIEVLDIKQEVEMIKTVLITKGIMPECFAHKVEDIKHE